MQKRKRSYFGICNQQCKRGAILWLFVSYSVGNNKCRLLCQMSRRFCLVVESYRPPTFKSCLGCFLKLAFGLHGAWQSVPLQSRHVKFSLETPLVHRIWECWLESHLLALKLQFCCMGQSWRQVVVSQVLSTYPSHFKALVDCLQGVPILLTSCIISLIKHCLHAACKTFCLSIVQSFLAFSQTIWDCKFNFALCVIRLYRFNWQIMPI